MCKLRLNLINALDVAGGRKALIRGEPTARSTTVHSDGLPFKSSHSHIYEIVVRCGEERLVQIEHGGKNVARF